MSLPPATVGGVAGTAYKNTTDEIDRFRANINSHSRYLTDSQFTAYSDRIHELTQAAERHRAAGEEPKYGRKLDELHKLLEGINNFIEFEKSQGLVGTCVDSGVRIYVRGDKVWLCSPDEKAFNDLRSSEKEQLSKFVEGLTGVQVDFNSASFQDQKLDGAVPLLGCRLDSLRLQKLGADEKYSVRTRLRTAGEFVDTTISFTFGELKAGQVPGIFGQNKALPPVVYAVPKEIDPDRSSPDRGRPATDSLRITPLAVAARPPVLPLEPEVKPVPRVPPPDPEAKLRPTLDERNQLREAIRRETSPIDLEKAKAHLETLQKGQRAFEEAVNAQRKILEVRIKATVPGHADHIAATDALAKLESAWTEDVMLRKGLLERQLTSPDPAVSNGAKRGIAGLRSDVESAYNRLINAEGEATKKTALTLERDAFVKQAAECRAATAGPLERLLDRATAKLPQAAEQIKLRLQQVQTAIETRVPSVAKARTWIGDTWTAFTSARPSLPTDQATAVKVLQERLDARTRIDAARSTMPKEKLAEAIAELDSSQAAYDRALKLRRTELEGQKSRNGWASADHQNADKMLRDLAQSEAKDIVLRSELRLKELELADAKAKPGLQRALERTATTVRQAYDTVLGDSALPPTERPTLEAQRDAFRSKAEGVQPARGGVRGWMDRVVARVQSAAQVEISIPGVSRARGYFSRLSERAVLADADAVIKRVGETAVDKMSAAEKTSELSALERSSERFKSQIRRLGDSSEPTVVDQVKKLKEADAKAVVRRGEILERQLAEATEPKVQTALKQRLHAEAGEIEGAHRHLGQNDAADGFKQRVKGFTDEVNREAKIQAVSSDAAVAEATNLRRQVEARLAKAAAGTPEHAELTATKNAALARENLAVAEAEYASMRQKNSASAPGAPTEVELSTKRAEVIKLRETNAEARVKLSETRIANTDARIAAVEAELRSTAVLKPGEAIKLHQERQQLLERKADLVVKHETLIADGYSSGLKQDLVRLQGELDTTQAQLRAEKNADQKPALEQAVAKIRAELLDKERQLHETEARNYGKQRSMLDGVTKEIDKRIADARAAGKADEVKRLEKTKARVESKATVLKANEDYHTGMQKVVEAKIRADGIDSRQARAQAELGELKKAATAADPKTADIARLENELKTLNEARTAAQADVVSAQKAVNVSTSRMLKQSVQNFEARLNAGGEWAKANPLKAATIVAAVGEGLRNLTTASYKPESKHTALPSLLLLLDSDLEDGFFGANVQFKTKDGGVVLSALAEFTSGAGNAAIVMGGFAVTQKTLALTVGRTAPGRWVGTKLATATAGRALVGVGAAADGFLTFYDFNSWKDDTSLQLAGKTASPIALGAGFGAFFGPPGALIGAFAGAVGEFGGLVWAARSVDREMDKDWRKRGVRDSIRQAEEGYVYTADHPVLRGRSRDLNDFESETIGDLSKQNVLGQLFAAKGGWSHDDLRSLGFRIDNSEESGRHNWERLGELLEQAKFRWVYNLIGDRVRIWENESQKACDAHNELWNRLHTIRAEAENYYRDRYFEAPRVSYENQRQSSTLGVAFGGGSSDGGVSISNERPQLFREAADLYRARMKEVEDEIAANKADRSQFGKELCEAQWRVLVEKFPQLGRILANEISRRGFFAQFKAASGVDLEKSEFWTHKALSPTGIVFVSQAMPDELKAIPTIGLKQQLSEVDKLSEALLKD